MSFIVWIAIFAGAAVAAYFAWQWYARTTGAAKLSKTLGAYGDYISPSGAPLQFQDRSTGPAGGG